MVLTGPAEAARPEDAPELLDLSVVIVNYNVRGLLRDCLRSLEPDLHELRGEVWVVDNASQDGSAEMVAEEFPSVRLVRNEQNRGYAAANNQAIREARGRHVLVLNPDTKLPPGAILACLAEMDRHPDIGALGPKLVRANGSLDRACRRSFPSPEVAFFRLSGLAKLFPNHPRVARYNLLDVDPDTPLDVDSVCGAFMLVRREVIERVGMFDETFRMYGEDLDWAYRIKAAGWRVRYHPSVVVIHYKGQSSRQRPASSIRAFYHAMHVFYDKYYAPTRPAPFNALIHAAIWGYEQAVLLRNRSKPKA
ncbi:MAG: glycosyltransferase family 2 protein [Chloroflexota bacterium]|nr:glycosyltransferase family 2 protein [Chloroflexota bacterium]